MLNRFIEWLTVDGNTKANRKKVQRGTVWVEKAAYNENFKPRKFIVVSANERADFIRFYEIGRDRRQMVISHYRRLFENYWMENVKER